jgi:hypothetical protein
MFVVRLGDLILIEDRQQMENTLHPRQIILKKRNSLVQQSVICDNDYMRNMSVMDN